MKAKNDLEKIKEFLEIIKHKIDMIEFNQTANSASISLMRDQLSLINSKLDSHTAALVNIKSVLTGYADMYQINKNNNKKMQKGLEILEEDAGVDVPPELQLVA